MKVFVSAYKMIVALYSNQVNKSWLNLFEVYKNINTDLTYSTILH